VKRVRVKVKIRQQSFSRHEIIKDVCTFASLNNRLVACKILSTCFCKYVSMISFFFIHLQLIFYVFHIAAIISSPCFLFIYRHEKLLEDTRKINKSYEELRLTGLLCYLCNPPS